MRRRWIWIAPLAILAIPLFIFIGGEIVMYLWNWLLPGLFGWHQITFWQALGLLLLCRILFGSHAFRGSRGSGMRYRMRQRMGERWEQMTPEKREKAHRARGRCGFEPPEAKPTT